MLWTPGFLRALQVWVDIDDAARVLRIETNRVWWKSQPLREQSREGGKVSAIFHHKILDDMESG